MGSHERILEWQREAAAEGAPGVDDPTSSFTFTDHPEGAGTTLEALRRDQAAFARERDWDKFHTPRNVLMAMVSVAASRAHSCACRRCTPGCHSPFPAPERRARTVRPCVDHGQLPTHSHHFFFQTFSFLHMLMRQVGEVGELSELFQWRGDEGCAPGLPLWSEEDKVHLGEEMADVLLYLVRLADRCRVDLPAAAKRKLER